MKKMVKRLVSMTMAALLSMSILVACGSSNSASEVVENPALTLDGAAISMEEANFYTYTMKLQYESYYGPDFWDMELEEGKTYGDELKEIVEEKLVQMLILNAKAKEYNLKLTEEDQQSIADYIENFKTGVGEDVMTKEGITEDVIGSTLEKILMASYGYEAMAEDEKVELTEEEKAAATCVRVQHILISTMETTKQDAEGNAIDMTEDEVTAYKAEQKALAEAVLEKAKSGEDFKALSDEYTSENAGFEFAFDKNGFDPVRYSYMVEPFYKTSWELAEGEISGLVESDYGYHIIKCISVNDETATQAAVELLKNDKTYVALDEKVFQMAEEAEITVSDEWEEYRVKSSVVAETEVETTAETTVETVE